MKGNILITRPIDDAETLAEKLRKESFNPIIVPMMRVEFLSNINDGIDDDTMLPDNTRNGLIFTSANGVRAFMYQLNKNPHHRADILSLPVYAVGEKTTMIAKDSGFSTIHTAGGNSDKLYTLICQKAPKDMRFYHGSADNHPHHLAERLQTSGFDAIRKSLYRTIAEQQIPDNFLHYFSDLTAIMLFSPRTAEIFLANFCNHALQKERKYNINFVCLSKAVCQTTYPYVQQWAEAGIDVTINMQIADKTSDEAMLQGLKKLLDEIREEGK